MPELPEVLTTIKQLKPKVINRKITKIWIDKRTKTENLISKSKTLKLVNRKIVQITNIGKYLLFHLDNNQTLIIHQKISGHLLFGQFIIKNNCLKPIDNLSPINDPVNRFIRFGLKFQSNNWMVLSDARRLARITLTTTDNISNIKPIKQMGLDPLSRHWTFVNFSKKLQTHNIAIKTALLSQNIIIGLGNIYSDEVLFKSQIHPLRKISTLNQDELHKLFKYIPSILQQAIKAGGTTFATYRTPNGNIGTYVNFLNVYNRKNQPCKICKYTIQSTKLHGRTTYFCKNCQK